VTPTVAARSGLALVLTLAGLLDLLAVSSPAAQAAAACSLLLGAFALALVHRRNRLPARRLGQLTAACALLSLTGTLALRLTAPATPTGTWGLFETTSLLVLLGVLARRAAGRTEAWCLLLAALAVVSAPQRLSGPDAVTFSLLVALAAAFVVAVGLLRRADDHRAADALRQVVADERRDIARDLHDDIAHHVTGMIVTAQAAAYAPNPDSSAQQAAFRAIERAGIDALQAMRGLVGVLREPADGYSAMRDQPASAALWPADLTEIVDRFSSTSGLTATLSITGAPVTGAQRHATRRVVQEALTNTFRHATDATCVAVHIEHEPSQLHIRVTDDGQVSARTGHTAPGRTGGYGLLGVHERAVALGGSAAAGPRAAGGWQVEVTLPKPAPADPSRQA